MPGAAVEKGADNVPDILINQPVYMNYGRVALDALMAVILIFVITSDPVAKSDLDNKQFLHVHEVPIYIKHDIPVGDIWAKAQLATGLKTDEEKLAEFKKHLAVECLTIELHPLCKCVADSGTSTIQTKNCLLQNPQPSVTSDWNVGTVSSAMILWFVASLATSVGTLPFIETYMTRLPDTTVTIIQYNKWLVATYCILVVCSLVLPIITTAAMFQGKAKWMESLMNMLMWSACALISLGVYNYKTVACFMGYSVDDKSDHQGVLKNWQRASVNNFILYVHLLVSAPAIAMILHMTQQWTEYSTIINTTLVLSTIFAVDAFSAEMSNYWSSHAQDSAPKPHETPHDGSTDKKISNMHMRLGLIRMFAWVINVVMILLLFTLAYPIEVEHQKTNSAIFVVIVVAYGAVFLAPDLVREFTDRVSFNSIQFRLYGDCVVRAMTLFFVWRASVVERE